ncbi:MAG: hypothetical protein LBS40_00500, partial [Burkholderiales bacterium]|nr:hypothetical protein [Burkholderiales bacterium]
YTLDANGRKTRAVETIEGQTRTIDYRYDETGKLLQEKVTAGVQIKTTDYQYDKVGNRAKKTENGVETTYVYNDNDQLTEETTGANTIRYRYDANGNLTKKETPQGTITYTWNSDNRLTGIDDQTTGKVITYRLDAEGKRIGKTAKEGTTTTETQYLVDPARPYSEIMQHWVRVNGGAWQERLYVHTPDGVGDLISQTTGGDTAYILQDGQGSSRITVDATGAVQDVISFDAFGNRTDGFGRTADETLSTDLSHLYVGELFDADANLYHLRARDYDPQTGRFTARDEFEGSILIPLSLNNYIYANDDPVNMIDPSGRFFSMAQIGIAVNIGGAFLTGYGIGSGIMSITEGNVARGVTEITLSFMGVGALAKSVSVLKFIVQKAGPTRAMYSQLVQRIDEVALAMKRAGSSYEQIAKKVVGLRNETKVSIRGYLSRQGSSGSILNKWAEVRNYFHYGDSVGPSAEWLFKRKKQSMLGQGLKPTDEEVWKEVVAGASRSSSEYDAAADIAQRMLEHPLSLFP